jgi:hypothetical protein
VEASASQANDLYNNKILLRRNEGLSSGGRVAVKGEVWWCSDAFTTVMLHRKMNVARVHNAAGRAG